MILIQHADATKENQEQLKKATNEKHIVILEKDFELVKNLENTEILFTYGKGMTIDTFKQMPNLKWIQLSATGFEHLPIDYLVEKKIQLTTIKGAHVKAISEYAFSCMLYFVRKMDRFMALQVQKKWDRFDYPGELCDKTLVILGTGNIGKEIAKKAEVFSMKTIGLNREGTSSVYFQETYPLNKCEEVIKKADFLILALPLTTQTHQIIGEKELRSLKKSAVVINLGRGGLVDERAVEKCLESDTLRGVALDVFEEEPLPQESPLWVLPRLLLTPHMAAKSDRFLDRCFQIFIKNYKNYIDGKELLNEAKFKKGY